MTQIINRYTGNAITEGDMSLRELVLHYVKTENDAGRFANLSSANLRSADLSSADLSSADLSSADLRFANLSSADLSFANMSSADLSSADLSSADLSSANMSSADLRFANMSSANLRFANMSSADLSYANLRYANLDYSAWPLQCSSNKAIVCDKIAAQLLYHAFAVAKIKPTKAQIDFMAKNFHRYNECGGIETIIKEVQK